MSQRDRPLTFRTTSVVLPILIGVVALLGVPIASSLSRKATTPDYEGGLDGIKPESIPEQAQILDARTWAALEKPIKQSENDGSTPFIPPGHTPDTLSSRPFHIYDPAFLALLGPNPSLTLLAEHPSNPLFHEACVWHPSTKSVFFAQNAGAHAAGTGLEKSAILQRISLDEVEALVEREKKGLRGEGEYVKVETVGETPQVINPNGGILWDDGGIVFAGEGQGEEIASALYLVNPRPPYNTTVLLNNFHGRQFNSLNDVAVLGSWIYFTDVDYGHVQNFRHPVNIPRQVYRFNPRSGVVQAVGDGMLRPNGLCFSPDARISSPPSSASSPSSFFSSLFSSLLSSFSSSGSANRAQGGDRGDNVGNGGNGGNDANGWLYVTDTGAALGHHGLDWSLPASIYRFPLRPDGTLGPKELFAFPSPGVPDGIHTDAEGNVYAGLGDGVHVWDSAGTLLGKIYVGDTCANFQFTDKGIVILAETRVWFAQIGARGDCIPGLKRAGAC